MSNRLTKAERDAVLAAIDFLLAGECPDSWTEEEIEALKRADAKLTAQH